MRFSKLQFTLLLSACIVCAQTTPYRTTFRIVRPFSKLFHDSCIVHFQLAARKQASEREMDSLQSFHFPRALFRSVVSGLIFYYYYYIVPFKIVLCWAVALGTRAGSINIIAFVAVVVDVLRIAHGQCVPICAHRPK